MTIMCGGSILNSCSDGLRVRNRLKAYWAPPRPQGLGEKWRPLGETLNFGEKSPFFRNSQNFLVKKLSDRPPFGFYYA